MPQKLPLLAAALPFVGHFQTRNKGTVCGSVAHADPASEIPLSLAVLEGEVVLRSRKGTRVLAAGEFQQGMLATARAPDELITAVRFPVAGNARRGVPRGRAPARRFRHRGGRRRGRERQQHPDRRRRHDRTARPCAASSATACRHRKDAIERLAWELEGYDDIHASARMRRDLLRRIGPVVIEEAIRCAA